MFEKMSTIIEVRFSDLDAYKHVNNAVYLTYLETARTKVFKGLFQDLSEQGVFLLLVRAECNYKRPIELYDNVVITLWVAATGRTSFDIEYEVHDGQGRTFATAKTTMVCFDDGKKQVLPLPAQFIKPSVNSQSISSLSLE
jgi:acyl-CoA thioester hydrolase